MCLGRGGGRGGGREEGGEGGGEGGRIELLNEIGGKQ
jgi:hypothetical protein